MKDILSIRLEREVLKKLQKENVNISQLVQLLILAYQKQCPLCGRQKPKGVKK